MGRHIYTFLAASLALHAAAVMVLFARPTTPTRLISASISSAPVISIALQTARPQRRAVHHHRHKARPLPVAKPKPLVAAAAPTRQSPKQSPQTKISAQVGNPAYQAKLHRQQLRDRVLSRLQVNLRQYFNYPPLARRQGWQGRVLLGFSIEANGMIRNIHVAAGSGYAILDSSAMAALARVQRLQPVEAWRGQPLELLIPVIYRLQGG